MRPQHIAQSACHTPMQVSNSSSALGQQHMHQSLRMRETQVTAVLKTAQFKITLSFCRVFFMEVYLRPWCPILAICAESSDPAEPRDDAPCWHRLTPCLPNGKAGTCPPAGHGYFGCCCLFFFEDCACFGPKKEEKSLSGCKACLQTPFLSIVSFVFEYSVVFLFTCLLAAVCVLQG